jgi:hypothetical protein
MVKYGTAYGTVQTLKASVKKSKSALMLGGAAAALLQGL